MWNYIDLLKVPSRYFRFRLNDPLQRKACARAHFLQIRLFYQVEFLLRANIPDSFNRRQNLGTCCLPHPPPFLCVLKSWSCCHQWAIIQSRRKSLKSLFRLRETSISHARNAFATHKFDQSQSITATKFEKRRGFNDEVRTDEKLDDNGRIAGHFSPSPFNCTVIMSCSIEMIIIGDDDFYFQCLHNS